MGDSDLVRMLGRTKLSQSSSKSLIIAIDFGTTFSGVAYCFPEQRDAKPHVVEIWPGARGIKHPKIPTVVEYDRNDSTQFRWGALVQAPSDSIIGVKLLLDPSQTLPSYLPPNNLKKLMKSLPKLPREIATDFIRELHAHAMSHIATKIAGTDLSSYAIDYVMSVPAVWSDAAKNATLEAAKEAGIFPVTLIKEPEAAALYTIREQDFELEPGDVLVVCDAGGGTVDLVSYKVEKTLPTLQLNEIVPGTGAMVGSLALNRRFAAYLQDIIPEERWDAFKCSSAIVEARKQFEDWVKKDFVGDPDKEYYIRLRGAGLDDDPENNLLDDEWCMDADTVSEIFEPVVIDILRLIRDQVQSVRLKNETVKKAIFLVGGFGDSQYLLQRVRKDNETIKVAQPTDAWAAIAKGAALSKMPNNAVVTSVSAVRHYGVTASCVFDSKIDMGQQTFVDAFDGTTRVQRMSWYIRKGDSIGRLERIKLPFFTTFPDKYTEDDLIIHAKLHDSDDRVAPVHRSEAEKINVNCTLIADLRKVPKSNLIRAYGPSNATHGSPRAVTWAGDPGTSLPGKPYWRISYDLVISFKSALMMFSLEINGEPFGSVEAHFKQTQGTMPLSRASARQ